MSLSDAPSSALHVMIVGEAGVGKRSFVSQLEDVWGESQMFMENEYIWTIRDCEVIFHITDITQDSVSDRALQIRIGECDAFILMHLVEDKESFEVLPLIKDIILKEKGMETDLPIFVVGYRVDCKEFVTESKVACLVVWDWMMNYREVFENNMKHVTKLCGDIMSSCQAPTAVAANTYTVEE
ncbi:GTP-binding protein Di-Ras1-like [Haliotis asinina]|uniref:GTP-binding protein Di-Ras1-like n=1 Tax=Haliotis asinina TaxID=109174 RepID=UPI0035327263